MVVVAVAVAAAAVAVAVVEEVVASAVLAFAEDEEALDAA